METRMSTFFSTFRARVRNIFRGSRNARLRRRRALSRFIGRQLPTLRALLLFAGYLWFLALPSHFLGRGTYIDENALQPSQVNTYWNWQDVHHADVYLAQLEKIQFQTSEERGEFITSEFKKLGLHTAAQSYQFTTELETIRGVNSYAIMSAPRTSGTEAMIISASWLSSISDGTNVVPNLRGIATVLSLASFLRRYSHWAKDIIFVVGDGLHVGVHAWLSAYHSDVQSNLKTQTLNLTSGVVWNALNIDYPGHSFSHLGVFYEGVNGRLPNQDLINSFNLISRYTGDVPVALYDHLDPRDSNDKSYPPAWLSSIASKVPALFEYLIRGRNILRHMYHQSLGRGSGVHSVYHKYRIDAITVFAIPGNGPHGFHSIGRVIESTLRTMNNLLERLHASVFFYILTTPSTFLKIGHYLPSVILISVAIMFGGLREWVAAGWVLKTNTKEKAASVSSSSDTSTNLRDEDWEPRSRPVLDALLIMLAMHALGALSFFVSVKGWRFATGLGLTPSFLIFSLIKFHALFYACFWIADHLPAKASTGSAPLSIVLKSLNMFLTSTLISVTSLLNFSLSVILCVAIGLPLILFSGNLRDSDQTLTRKGAFFLTYTAFLMTFFTSNQMLWSWSILGNLFLPLLHVVYLPLLLQAGLVCRL